MLFVSKEGDVMPKTGDYLGNMTDEMTRFGSNAYITEFAAGGPKNYAYKVRLKPDSDEEKTVCKVKGIRLNYMNSKIIHFDTIKNLLLNHDETDGENRKIELKNSVILRENDNIIYTGVRKYNYRINVTKRRRLYDNMLVTLPFGHT